MPTTPEIPQDAPSVRDMTGEQFAAHLRANHPTCDTIGSHDRFHAAFDGILAHVHVGETGSTTHSPSSAVSGWDASTPFRWRDIAARNLEPQREQMTTTPVVGVNSHSAVCVDPDDGSVSCVCGLDRAGS